jgi:hypothetical protein
MNSFLTQALALLSLVFGANPFTDQDNQKIPKVVYISESKQDDSVQPSKFILKTIKNSTCYDILLVDRLAEDKSIVLPASKTTTVEFEINNQNTVIMNGNMVDIMNKDAQYVFQKLDQNGNPELGQEVYFNMHTCPGGVNNGSNVIVGTLGSLILHFYVAGKNGGCTMNSGKINGDGYQTAEYTLELSPIISNAFKLNIINSEITYK